MNIFKLLKWLGIFSILLILVIIYKHYNPLNSGLFPKCPFKAVTGYKCPGCGSQRAIHYLLNGDILTAMKQNILLVLSIPYLIIGAIFDIIELKSTAILKIRKVLYGTTTIYIILFIVIFFWIFRNFTQY